MSTTPYLEQDTASSHKGDVKNGGSSAEVAAETVDSTPVDGVFGSEERNDIKVSDASVVGADGSTIARTLPCRACILVNVVQLWAARLLSRAHY